ncbi:hypothetical protein [Streptomyces sp. NBC_01216]|uniref:hypothetical protein n=1 Tax=unclassified Streptomyces TaxID=2593676 RepID=UPI002E140F87|nr:hypothetical protein OG393_24920 [Streptomyces sp. NBC_01216]
MARMTTTVAATGAALFLAATPASAGTDVYVATSDPWDSGTASFRAYGESVTVCDNRSDGKRAVAHLIWTDSRASHYERVDDANGSNNGCVTRDFEIGEGIRVSLQVCLRDGYSGTPQYCTTKRGTA